MEHTTRPSGQPARPLGWCSLRLPAIRGDTIRVCGDDDDPHGEPRSLIVGVAISTDHSNCVQSKIEHLRARLAKINADDITDSTARYAVEREIYDIEHPKADEEESADDEFEGPDVKAKRKGARSDRPAHQLTIKGTAGA